MFKCDKTNSKMIEDDNWIYTQLNFVLHKISVECR